MNRHSNYLFVAVGRLGSAAESSERTRSVPYFSTYSDLKSLRKRKGAEQLMAISQLSLSSLMLTPILSLPGGGDEEMSVATGFIVQHDSRNYLITNWHVVSGRRSDDGQPLASHGALPDKIKIWHNHIGMPNLISWVPTVERLVDDEGAPLWLEHPRFGRKVDAIALPLSITTGISFMPFSLEDGSSGNAVLTADVPDSVNIIGFPFGESAAARIAIWAKGSIATDMEVDYGSLPCFLIDSRTRQGQSGSPVVVYKGPSDNGRLTNGSVIMGGGIMSRLLGVYSGRINRESDLGKVWKASAISEILQHGVPGNRDLTAPPPGFVTFQARDSSPSS